jgi:hypothetical protein
MKIALCFIISYEHIVNKEHLWREWIEPNKDIINVYFYYKDLTKIKSSWILEHTIPANYIHETSYYHVIPAYLSLMRYSVRHDTNNTWFCMLTDSCCPIISPKKFRYLFYQYYNKSIMSWRPAWWNVQFHKRANLAFLPIDLRLANDPWFVMKREDVTRCIRFINNTNNKKLISTICNGGLANESLFAIILDMCKQLKPTNKNINVISSVTHATDWSRMTSATSPHLFKEANELDVKFIDNVVANEPFVLFIRKISPEFPDEILRYYIYEYGKEEHEKMVLIMPLYFVYLKYKLYILSFAFVLICGYLLRIVI